LLDGVGFGYVGRIQAVVNFVGMLMGWSSGLKWVFVSWFKLFTAIGGSEGLGARKAYLG
jgi:hypothetical protein